MKLKRTFTVFLGSIGATLVSVLGATSAVATEGVASADDCGLSIIHQAYKNCTPGTEVVEITYVSSAPGGRVGYPKVKYCIPTGQTKNVARPDGMLAQSGAVFAGQKCGPRVSSR